MRTAERVGSSIISVLELLAYRDLCSEDEAIFAAFRERVETIGVGAERTGLLGSIVRIRRDHAMKLPDAIIAATAMEMNAILVTADEDFRRVSGLAIGWGELTAGQVD